MCVCVCAGRWEARIGIPGSKHIYLGLYNMEKEAAQAYDRALVRLRGTAAATNFALSDYRSDLAEYHKMQQVSPPTPPPPPLTPSQPQPCRPNTPLTPQTHRQPHPLSPFNTPPPPSAIPPNTAGQSKRAHSFTHVGWGLSKQDLL